MSDQPKAVTAQCVRCGRTDTATDPAELLIAGWVGEDDPAICPVCAACGSDHSWLPADDGSLHCVRCERQGPFAPMPTAAAIGITGVRGRKVEAVA